MLMMIIGRTYFPKYPYFFKSFGTLFGDPFFVTLVYFHIHFHLL